jgi:alpha-mannosidase
MHPEAFPAMFTGKWPLPEATLYSKAFRRSNQGDMRDRGITNFRTVEPGLGNHCVFDYAIGSEPGMFDAVAAMRFGLFFDVPLIAAYVPFAQAASQSGIVVDQPNVRIDTVKEAENNKSAAITPTNLENAAPKRQFIIRLQEIAGRNTRAAITLPAPIRSAAVVNLTEDREIATLPATAPLVVSLTPYQTLTVRFELQEDAQKQK